MTEDIRLQEAAEIVRALRAKGHEALFAGGCVRDLVMGAVPHDYDVATTASPNHIEDVFPKTVGVGKKFGVILVLKDDRTYEVATFRKEGPYADGRHPDWVKYVTPEEDARRRDFTVNALFYDPVEKKIHDFVEGEKDIARKVIRAVGDPEERFIEDHLRMLRAVRFSANLGFEIEAGTWEALKRLAPKINSVSMERVRDEIVKMFSRPNAGKALHMLSDSGLLKIILPELEKMKGVAQPPQFHPEGDVFVHTALMLDMMENPAEELALSVLFHDVAKPDTFDDTTDRIRFNFHSELGAKKAAGIMRRLRFPNRTIERVSIAINNHLKFKDIKNMRKGRLRRYLASDTFPLELELHRLDCLGSHGMLDNYRFCKDELAAMEKENMRPKPFVDGHDLMNAGFKPGPQFKSILEELYVRQLEGRVKDTRDGVAQARKLFKESK